MSHDITTLRIGFREGIVSRDDVREWVDREIAQRDELPSALLELATLAHKPDHEVLALMGQLEGVVPGSSLARTELAALAELYKAQRATPRQIMARLENMASCTEGLSEHECAEIWGLVGDFDLAEDRTYGSVAEVQARLDEFLRGYDWPRCANVEPR